MSNTTGKPAPRSIVVPPERDEPVAAARTTASSDRRHRTEHAV